MLLSQRAQSQLRQNVRRGIFSKPRSVLNSVSSDSQETTETIEKKRYEDSVLNKLGRDLTELWGFVEEDTIDQLVCTSKRCMYLYYRNIDDKLIKHVQALHNKYTRSIGEFMPFILPSDIATVLRGELMNLMNTDVARCDIIRHSGLIQYVLEEEPVLKPLKTKISEGFIGIIIQIEQTAGFNDIICFKLKPDILTVRGLTAKEKTWCTLELIRGKCHNCEAKLCQRTCQKCHVARFCSRSCERFKKKTHARSECDDFFQKYTLFHKA